MPSSGAAAKRVLAGLDTIPAYYLWVGIFAPKGTPADAVKALREALDKASHTDSFKATLANVGLELDYMDEPEFAKFWAGDAKHVVDAVDLIGRVQG